MDVNKILDDVLTGKFIPSYHQDEAFLERIYRILSYYITNESSKIYEGDRLNSEKKLKIVTSIMEQVDNILSKNKFLS